MSLRLGISCIKSYFSTHFLLFSESTIGVVFFICGKDEKNAHFKKVLFTENTKSKH